MSDLPVSDCLMVLQAQNGSLHNQMLGKQIKHPPSTKFYEEDFENPTAKRLKRLDSTDSSLSRRDESEEPDSRPSSPTVPRREIPDSEAESDEEDQGGHVKSGRTELEIALAPVKTDKAAIADYEANRAAGEFDPELHERLGQRKWVAGKSSIYVDAFNLALETVLEDESHLFDVAELAVFETWRRLSYEGQYLWVLKFREHS